MNRRLLLRLIAASAAVLAVAQPAVGQGDAAKGKAYRVLHIASYHLSMGWSAGQLKGFQEGMGDAPVEYRMFEMDILRDRSDLHLRRRSAEAQALIASWKPDLVYGSDDAALEFVMARFAGTPLPLVFSGVNRDPKVYGMAGAPNVAGVIEHEHIAESIAMLRKLVPGARRLVALFDSSPHWDALRERVRATLAGMPEVEVITWDTVLTWSDYQRKIKDYQKRADAILSFGYFDFSATDGVSNIDLSRWTVQNNRLPDVALWDGPVQRGSLAAVSVSEREQGLAAGRMARVILLEGRSPASFPMKPTMKGVPVLSLARARDLGIKPAAGVLLSTKVHERYLWEGK